MFSRKIRVLNPLSSYDSISNFEDYINHYIYLYLLGGTLVLNELHFDSGEQRQLNETTFQRFIGVTCSKKLWGLAGILNKGQYLS